jgi:hypothetical protein
MLQNVLPCGNCSIHYSLGIFPLRLSSYIEIFVSFAIPWALGLVGPAPIGVVVVSGMCSNVLGSIMVHSYFVVFGS